MGLRRLSPSTTLRAGSEHLARIALALVTLAVPLAVAVAWWGANRSPSAVTIHGRVSEAGGWLPGTLRAVVFRKNPHCRACGAAPMRSIDPSLYEVAACT